MEDEEDTDSLTPTEISSEQQYIYIEQNTSVRTLENGWETIAPKSM